MVLVKVLLMGSFLCDLTLANYQCLCATGDAQVIYKEPSPDSPTLIGELSQSECAQLLDDNIHNDNFFAIWSEEDTLAGYVWGDNVYFKTCEGDSPIGGVFPTSSINPDEPCLIQEYIGLGYNALKGNPDLGTDPGLLKTHILQVPNDTVASCDLQEPCKLKSFLVHGSKSLQDEMKYFVNLSDAHEDLLHSKAFTDSTDFLHFAAPLEKGSYVFQDHINVCRTGTTSYDQPGYILTEDFERDLCDLATEGPETYHAFFDRFGTSVVVQVDYGYRELKRHTLSVAELFIHIQNLDSGLLDHGGPMGNFSSSLSIDPVKYAASDFALHTFSTYTDIQRGTKDNQTVIALHLVPLIEVVTSITTCTDQLERIIDNMLNALPSYAGSLNLEKTELFDFPLRIPVTWPLGTYGLMKTVKGCPGGQVTWSEGWRKQDTEDTNSNTYFSKDIALYMAGEFGRDVRTEFCLKTNNQISEFETNWPKGTYCLLKKGSCPAGLLEGYVRWDDENSANANSYGGVLPDGHYDDNTQIYYCCRDDGSPSKRIILPVDKPFILIRYGDTCQEVFGINVFDMYIRWDDNDLGFDISDDWGMHPYDEVAEDHGNHLLHFCYYANRTILIDGQEVNVVG